jgi:AraC-like DNA-binding protein
MTKDRPWLRDNPTKATKHLVQTSSATYSTAILFGALCKLMELEPHRVVATAGLPDRIATGHGVQITADEFILLWDTILDMATRTDLPTFIGRGMANGSVSPVFFAMSCAKDLQTGFARFARFKTVFGPVGMTVRNSNAHLYVALVPVHPQPVLPASPATPILIFLHEKARSCTARQLIPEQVFLPLPKAERAALTDVFGVSPQFGDPMLVYSTIDAQRPLVSENEALWEAFEADLNVQVTVSNRSVPISHRVRACLVEAIMDRDPSVAYVCERLSRSRSGLLRDLQKDDTTFQEILDDTRKTLALRYLKNSDMPIKQIAELLAYRDPNAFHRAFKTWTGKTPNELRRSRP